MSYREILTGIVDQAVAAFSGNDSGNAPVMLMLGGFKFGVNTAVFQQLQRDTAYRWAAQERVGQYDALQYTGPADDRITLPGIIYPQFRGGPYQIDTLRQIASAGKPVRLISASGEILGLWVIESVGEVSSAHTVDGMPRRQEFTLIIRKFGDADV